MWNSTFKTPSKLTLKRTPFKKNARKRREWQDKSYLAACRGKRCYLQIHGVCLGESGRDTVVPAHANWPEYGKGMGRKADDIYTVPACSACHAWLDQGAASYEDKKVAWQVAYAIWSKERQT